ncbi:erythromycin esterase family protein [Leeuwenhoekiella marinoflava]|uniref:erythromycin esterase family protein n=1 Tax=Leeuwenhoekiella marinoflava TaxID=988 RepID=UPI0030022267
MNKILLTLTFILVFSSTQAQELQTVELLPPNSKNISDLSFLKEELQGKDLVMLGEMTHMYANIFEMKARIVKYLHQNLGFNTIAIESPMYDIWKMNQKGFNPDEFKESIWGVWSQSETFQKLINYIDQNNISVIGFDSQFIDTNAFIENFYDYCERNKIPIKVDEDDLGIIIEGVIESSTIEEEDIDYRTYENELQRILKAITKLESNETNYYWNQFIKSLIAGSQNAFYNTTEYLTTDFGNKNHNIRDTQMADNLLTYIARNPDEKIIVWADNIHIMNDNSSITKPVSKDFISMGNHIHESLKNKAYSLATIHANDSLFDTGTRRWEATPVQEGSFEAQLKKLQIPYIFISSNQPAMRQPYESRLLDFIDFTSVRLDQLHDGYIFLKDALIPSQQSTISSENPKLNLVNEEEAERTETGKTLLLKGQIKDKETDAEIPFATLILEEQEIYRVADENGFFELPVTKHSLKNASVSISSMGFEEATIDLKELKSTTYLTPQFQELAEVVVTGFLSPWAVLKKAVLSKKSNHPTAPFNFYRYGQVFISKNDTTQLDLELITKEYDHGYLAPYVITQRVEQVKWNKNEMPKVYKNSAQFFSYRQNAIRYANILHKRKYKKFNLAFVQSTEPEDEGLYIISFQTERNKWNYTNRGYPTSYSGRVYIKKGSFAIVKVVENWETKMNKEEIEKFTYKGNSDSQNMISYTIKEENTCVYEDIENTGKYYATHYFNRTYKESKSNEGNTTYSIFQLNSKLFDFELNEVEEIEYYQYNNKKENSLFRVEYDNDFWNNFYNNKLSSLNE